MLLLSPLGAFSGSGPAPGVPMANALYYYTVIVRRRRREG